MTPSEQIRKIWQEMKMMKRLYDGDFEKGISIEKQIEIRDELHEKYKEIEILFGHERTLEKSIIFYLDQKMTYENKEKLKKAQELIDKANEIKAEAEKL